MTDQTFHGLPIVTDTGVPEGAVVIVSGMTPARTYQHGDTLPTPEDLAEARAAAAVREHAEAAIVRHHAHARADLAPRPPFKFGPAVTIDREAVERARPAALDTLAVYRAHAERAARTFVRRFIAEAHAAGVPDDVAIHLLEHDDGTVRVHMTQFHPDGSRGLVVPVDVAFLHRAAEAESLVDTRPAMCRHLGTIAADAWADRYPEETTA